MGHYARDMRPEWFEREEPARAPRVKLTQWFPPGVEPVRDGVYLTRSHMQFGVSDCWHAMRWSGRARAWFSADSKGEEEIDAIAGDLVNRTRFWWRGLEA